MTHRVGNRPRSTPQQRTGGARGPSAPRRPPSGQAQHTQNGRRPDTFETRQRRGPNIDGRGGTQRRDTQERIAGYSDRQLAQRERAVKKGIKSAVKNERPKQAARLRSELKLIEREQNKRTQKKINDQVENASVGIDTKSEAWKSLGKLTPEEIARYEEFLKELDAGSNRWQGLDEPEAAAGAQNPEWSPLTDTELDGWLRENGYGSLVSPQIPETELARWDAEADLLSPLAALLSGED